MVQRYTLGSHGYIRLCCRSLCRFPDQIWFQYRTSSENYAGKSTALALHCSPDDQNRLIPCTAWNNWLITLLIPLQSIGFIGPGVSLLCLRFAQTPSVAAVLMTTALSLSSFSQAGYFCNIQVVIPSFPDQWSHTTSIPWTIFSLSIVLLPSDLYFNLTECVFRALSRTSLPSMLDPCTVCLVICHEFLFSSLQSLGFVCDIILCRRLNRSDERHRHGGRHS